MFTAKRMPIEIIGAKAPRSSAFRHYFLFSSRLSFICARYAATQTICRIYLFLTKVMIRHEPSRETPSTDVYRLTQKYRDAEHMFQKREYDVLITI